MATLTSGTGGWNSLPAALFGRNTNYSERPASCLVGWSSAFLLLSRITGFSCVQAVSAHELKFRSVLKPMTVKYLKGLTQSPPHLGSPAQSL